MYTIKHEDIANEIDMLEEVLLLEFEYSLAAEY